MSTHGSHVVLLNIAKRKIHGIHTRIIITVVNGRSHSQLLCLGLTLLEWTIARQELATAYWALFNVATWHVKFAFKYSAVVARKAICAPIVLFTAVPNT